MVIRTHGPASGDVAELIEQMSTFGGLCNVNTCADVQVAIFPGDDDDDDDDDD